MNHIFENESLIDQLQKISEYKVADSFLQVAYHFRKPVAIWKLPLQDQLNCIISFDSNTFNENLELEELRPGFIFNGFHSTQQKELNFIPADIYYNSGSKALHFNTLFSSSEKDILLEALEKKLTNGPSEKPHLFHSKDAEDFSGTSKEDYMQLVARAVEKIKSGQVDKIVPSKIKVLENPDIDLIESFKKLCTHYPNAFVSIVSIPEVGTWMCASPETLISVDKHKKFHTVALAGTQENKNETNLSEVAWRQKEIEEQALVSRYIINCFKKIRLREFDEVGPRTVMAGNLIHLKTDFKVDLKMANFPNLGSTMLQLLHPTSAVCGMPKEPAMEFLKKNEKHSRGFFSGYLGPVNINDEIHLFVNLRCMQLLKNKAVLYAGAGVTADSQPEKEWNETEIKCNTLLNMLQK